MRHHAGFLLASSRAGRVIAAIFAISCGGLILTGSAKAGSPTAASAVEVAESSSTPNSVLVVHSELEGLGIHVRRKRLDTPGASLTLEIAVDDNAGAGKFVQAECVVLRDTNDMKDLATTDASADLEAKVARRNASDKTDFTFLVLGREIERTYLVFEFSNAGKADQRYLLPVTAVPKRHS
ncbi:MAG TPA: hypothetical protein VIM69_10825 [Opitutaceae bacterium]